MAFKYFNPVGAGLSPQRIDQGVDYGGRGPLYALGSGVITSVYNSGWPGGSYIVIHLDNGRDVSYAEDITPLVRVGERVTGGQQIGVAQGGGDGIEIGWASGSSGSSMARAAGQTAAGERVGDPGRFTTAYGQSMSNLIASLGGPGGKTYGPVQGSVPANWGSAATPSSGGASWSPGSMPNPTASDYTSALGPLSGLLTTVPELHNLLQQAVSGGWSSAKFQQAVEQSSWYRSHNAATRELIALQASDPAEYTTRVINAENQVLQLAAQMGIKLTPQQMSNAAHLFLMQGWTTQTLQHQLAGYYNKGAQPFGQAAQIYQSLAKLYGDYAVPYNFYQAQYRTQQILAGNQTIDSYSQNAIKTAQSMFPGIAAQIGQGMTVRQIADPYVQAQANLLEIDPNTINISGNDSIKRALQGVPNAQGVHVAVPLWQYEQQVRNDPRWQFTNNSKDTISQALVQLGADFGFGTKG